MKRRQFLQMGAASAVVLATGAHPALGARRTGPPPRSLVTGRAYAPVAAFPSGILSGDPSTDGVVLWTRIDPVLAGAGATVDWEIGTDPAMTAETVVASGTALTDPTTDHTVHVEPTGLAAGATYWYRFVVDGTASPVGRTRTLPVGEVDRLRLAYFSCQRFNHGYYSAHADLAGRALDPATDVDVVVSLGDYVYEGGPADGVTVDGRVDPGPPAETLDEFRRQYHLYREDLDLQAMHAAFPLVAIFDNHDGLARPGDSQGPGAIGAFFEQMPVRRTPGEGDRQHRNLRWGDLLELFVLDERQYRDPTPRETDDLLGTSSLEVPEMVEPGRTLLGATQYDWLTTGLTDSPAAWKVIGSQLVFWPFRSERFLDAQAEAGDGPQRNAGRYLNMTQWDGYQDERRRLVDHIADGGISDVVVIAGDSHFWSAAELPQDWDDPDSPLVLTEFCGSSISSANADEIGLPDNTLIRPLLASANPYHLRYIEVTTHGYGIVELTAARATVTFVASTTITEPDGGTVVLSRFEVDRGTARIRQVEGSDFLPRPAEEPGEGPAPGDPPPAAPPAAPIDAAATFTG